MWRLSSYTVDTLTTVVDDKNIETYVRYGGTRDEFRIYQALDTLLFHIDLYAEYWDEEYCFFQDENYDDIHARMLAVKRIHQETTVRYEPLADKLTRVDWGGLELEGDEKR